MTAASLLAAGGWIAAVNNPSPHAVIHQVLSAVHGLFAGLFWRNPLTPGGGGLLHALVAGCVAGLAQGLAVGSLGQSFAWAFLFRSAPAALPGVAPALRCACLLGAAVGLGAVARQEWRVLWRTLVGREAMPEPAPAEPGQPPPPPPPPTAAVILLAAVPAFLLRWLLRHFTVQLEAAATVGVLLFLSAQILRRGQGWTRTEREAAPAVPPWAAALAGVAAGLAALPGVSGLAVFLSVALYARTAPAAAARFGLMAAALVSGLQGLLAVPAAGAALGPVILPAALGAGFGAYLGGRFLLDRLSRAGDGTLRALASYCEAVGGLMLLFGIFVV